MTTSHLMALLAGFFLPVQVALNSRLTSFTGSPAISSLVSFAVGTIALLVYVLTNLSTVHKASQTIFQAPFYMWLGGFVGCFYIVTSIVVTPKIGLAVALSLVIGGQLCMSMLFDHFGWLGMDVKPFTFIKGVGALLVLVGIFLIKK